MKNMVNKVLLLSEVLLRESIVSLTSVNASLSNQIIESDCKLTIAFIWNFQNWLFYLWLGTLISIASLLPQLPSITTFVKNILIEAPEVFGEFVEIIDEKDYGHVSNFLTKDSFQKIYTIPHFNFPKISFLIWLLLHSIIHGHVLEELAIIAFMKSGLA